MLWICGNVPIIIVVVSIFSFQKYRLQFEHKRFHGAAPSCMAFTWKWCQNVCDEGKGWCKYSYMKHKRIYVYWFPLNYSLPACLLLNSFTFQYSHLYLIEWHTLKVRTVLNAVYLKVISSCSGNGNRLTVTRVKVEIVSWSERETSLMCHITNEMMDNCRYFIHARNADEGVGVSIVTVIFNRFEMRAQ